MGEIHSLILKAGKQGALLADHDRRIVDAAAAYMAVEEGEVGFLYSGWAQAALPHRKLPPEAIWEVKNEHVTLIVQPGLRAQANGPAVPVGVPYGSRARLILLYLQTEALRSGSREVELGRSLHQWLNRLEIPIGGKSMRDVRDQAERISRCRMSFEITKGGRRGLINQSIVDEAMFFDVGDEGQGSLFTEKATLSQSFFDQLKKHPVPIEEAAVRQIANNSLALDVYCWLAYRLHVLNGPVPIAWKSLHEQFGKGVTRLDHFKTYFKDTLALAQAVYPAADVRLDARGVTLHPSPAPVKSRPPRLAGSR